MILNQPQTQVLGGIADGLAGSDPKLASMLNIFSRLAAGEQMPAHEKIPSRRLWPGTRRPRRIRLHPRRGTAIPQPRRRYPHPRRPQAMLLIWAAISAVLLASALLLNTSSHKASCIRPAGTACPASPSGSSSGH